MSVDEQLKLANNAYNRCVQKLDRLDALKTGEVESWKGEKKDLEEKEEELEAEKKRWEADIHELNRKIPAASTGNDFVTRRWGHRVVCT